MNLIKRIKRSFQKLPPTIIWHGAGFGLVFILSLAAWSITAVYNGNRYHLKSLTFWKNLASFHYQPPINCEPFIQTIPGWLPPSLQYIGANRTNLAYASLQTDSGWTIYQVTPDSQLPLVANIAFPQATLTQSFGPVTEYFVYPSCTEVSCQVNLFHLPSQTTTSLPAIAHTPSDPVADIQELFFDDNHQIISYTTASTDVTSRIVIDFEGKQIQAIDESPGINRQLRFSHYSPPEDTLVYYDEQEKHWLFYQVNRIGLFTDSCNQATQLFFKDFK